MKRRDFSTFILYAFGFLLLWEWLRPVGQLTDTSHIGTFIGFLVISFLANFLGIRWFWQWLIKIIYILTAVNRFHYQESFFQSHWLMAFLHDIKNNILSLIGRNWNDLSNEFRTLLFFVLLWIMVYLINYWLLRRQRIFIFFAMTLIYISVLDTFTPYSANWAIVRTIVSGFAVMGMLTFYRILKKENVGEGRLIVQKWMVPLAGMIAFSVLVGAIAPKAAPKWPDPVPYLTGDGKTGTAPGKGNGPARIGYGTNDAQLGGPFIGDNSLVYSYEAEEKNYWKVETKDLYTGKGWLPSGSTPIPFRIGDLVPVYSIPPAVVTTDMTARIMAAPAYRYNYMLYPVGIERYSGVSPADKNGTIFKIDTTTDRIQLLDSNGQPIIPKTYTVSYKVPKYNYSDLIKTTGYEPNDINLSFYRNYTRLPNSLPARIRTLTEDITKGKTNWYDKAKAVESYFGNSGFIYDQKDVAYPKDNQDYVDQFLFDTRRGYCDNFSTAMAVMLRSIGIPTRWVKGYTGGEFQKNADINATRNIYQVTNNNAHAWVEVFFPNVGWVPFEPTKGFSNNININYGTTGQTPGSSQQTPTPPPVKKPQKNPLEEKDQNTVQTKTSFSLKSVWTGTRTFWKNHWQLILVIIIIMAVLAGILYRIRGKWVPYAVLVRYRMKKRDEHIGPAYLMLLNQLERYGLRRNDNQTLRNYARYIDTFFSTGEMTELTKVYEQYIYRGNLPKGTWDDAFELWENLIKKTIA